MKLTAATTNRRKRHGHSYDVNGKRSPTYKSWTAMISRCTCPTASNYHLYGGRGITVCQRWLTFENFLADVGERPPGTTLDRFPNPNGNYEPGNVRWATAKQQAESRRPTSEWTDRPGPKNKTHCKRGHEMTPENTRINKGHHVCRMCASMHDKGRKAARKTGDVPMIHESATAKLVTCGNCDRGFRRVNGVHIASQRLGMIPDTPCERVFATHGGNMTDDNERPWMAYVDGEPLRKKSGDARRFTSAKTAYTAACMAAPQKWHP